VGSAESNDFLVVETMISSVALFSTKSLNPPHTVEDGSKVILSLAGIRESAIRSDVVLETVDPSRSPGDDGSARLLNGANTTKSPEITVRDPRELLLDLLHVLTGNVLT